MAVKTIGMIEVAAFAAALADGWRDDVQRIVDFYAAAEHESKRPKAVMAEEPATPDPAPISLYASLPARRPADHVETVTLADAARLVAGVGSLQLDLSQHAGRRSAKIVLEALLVLERESAQCRDIKVVMELVLSEFNKDKLDRIRGGIAFAIRIKGALDQAGTRGNPHLRLIEEGPPDKPGGLWRPPCR